MSSFDVGFNPEKLGYAKLPRSVIDHEVMRDDWLFRLYGWCLLKANWKPRHGLQIGQFITGRFAGSECLGVSGSKFYRGLKKLEAMGLIQTQPNNKNTVVTLCFIDTYEEPELHKRTTTEQAVEQAVNNATGDSVNGYDTSSQISEQPANNERTTSEQPADTIEEYKKLRIKEPPPPSSSKVSAYPPWVEEVERLVFNLGVAKARDCLEKAAAAGCSETYVRAVLSYFEDHHQANDWGPGVLFDRLKSASEWQDVEANWPQPGPKAKKEAQQLQRQRQHERQSQEQAERQRREAKVEELEDRFGAELGAMTVAEIRELAHSVGADFAKRLQAKKGNISDSSIRVPLLLKLEKNHSGQAPISMKEAL